MGACTFTISTPSSLTKDQAGTFQLTPTPDGAVCSVHWTINGMPAKAGNNYGDLHVVQVGFSEIIVRATADNPGAVIGATVECAGATPCGPTSNSVVFGGGYEEGIKGGNIVLIVLLPFIIVVGVALLPVFLIAFIIDKATDGNETKKVQKAGTELLRLLPRKSSRRLGRDRGRS